MSIESILYEFELTGSVSLASVTTLDDLVQIDLALGVSHPCETFAEVEDRLRGENRHDLARLYGQMEQRWFELLEDGQ